MKESQTFNITSNFSNLKVIGDLDLHSFSGIIGPKCRSSVAECKMGAEIMNKLSERSLKNHTLCHIFSKCTSNISSM